MIGAAESKFLLAVPALMAAAVAAPTEDLVMRWAFIGSALGAYVGTMAALKRRRSTRMRRAELAWDLIVRWSCSLALGWVGTVWAFEHYSETMPQTPGRIMGAGFVLGGLGWVIAMWALPAAQRWLDRREKAWHVASGGDPADFDTDPPK